MAATLPRELLVARRRGERIAPAFVPEDAEHLVLAERVTGIFSAAEGKRRGDLLAVLREEEVAAGTRFKKVRGLAALLERRCAFEMSALVDPVKARRAAWSASARRGGALTPDDRRAALAEAADALGVTVGAVERALEADGDENLVLVAFAPPSAPSLLREYNFGLAQAMLFDAVELTIEIRTGLRRVFQAAKREGLMHRIERRADGTHALTLDGPASALVPTRRYGAAMARMLPALRGAGDWRLTARVLDRPAPDEPAVERVFETDARELPVPEDAAATAESFDSRVEERFAEAFAALRNGWRLVREPALLPAGSSVLVPDFGFARGDEAPTVFLEIVGFWTPGYLARKAEKLRALPAGVDLLIAADRTLGPAAEALPVAEDRLILFEGDVPLAPVARALAERDAGRLDAEVAVARARGIPAGDVVTIEAWSRAIGVSAEACEAALATMDLGARERIGRAVVAPRALEAAGATLADGMALADAEARLSAAGIPDAASALQRLGWRAEWRGLAGATIRRAQ